MLPVLVVPILLDSYKMRKMAKNNMQNMPISRVRVRILVMVRVRFGLVLWLELVLFKLGLGFV